MFGEMTAKEIALFRKNLLAWFETHRRQLPWRDTDDPYCIWVSEVMLQQTQVRKVLEYYHNFVSKFPDVESLAEAALQDLLKTWEGLGYYARARNLHKAAQVVVEDLRIMRVRYLRIMRRSETARRGGVHRRCGTEHCV